MKNLIFYFLFLASTIGLCAQKYIAIITDYDKKVFNRLTAGEQERLRKACAKGFAKEAVRVVRAMPKWEPAEMDGEKVDVAFSLPVGFRLR